MGQGAKRIAFAGITAAAALFLSNGARAANGAYAVDAADIGEAGSCKVEVGYRRRPTPIFRRRHPLCAVNIRPVKFSMQTIPLAQHGEVGYDAGAEGQDQHRADRYPGDWAIPSMQAVRSTRDQENLTAFAVVRLTFRPAEAYGSTSMAAGVGMRAVDGNYLTYGLGFDWKFTDTLHWTIEACGQAGASADTPSGGPAAISDRRALPAEQGLSVDVIAGHNRTGA
jgi:hypothetical protein